MKQQNFAFKNLKRKGMKPTDLMTLDWVLWKNKYVQVVETSAIVYSFGQIDVRLAYCNDDGDGIEKHDISKISPIPLTPEILEKNGWHFDLTPYEKDLNECCGMSIDKHWCYADTNIGISLFFPITG